MYPMRTGRVQPTENGGFDSHSSHEFGKHPSKIKVNNNNNNNNPQMSFDLSMITSVPHFFCKDHVNAKHEMQLGEAHTI